MNSNIEYIGTEDLIKLAVTIEKKVGIFISDEEMKAESRRIIEENIEWVASKHLGISKLGGYGIVIPGKDVDIILETIQALSTFGTTWFNTNNLSKGAVGAVVSILITGIRIARKSVFLKPDELEVAGWLKFAKRVFKETWLGIDEIVIGTGRSTSETNDILERLLETRDLRGNKCPIIESSKFENNTVKYKLHCNIDS